MPIYRVIRPFANGSKLTKRGEAIELDSYNGKVLEQKGMVMQHYRDNSEKLIPEVNNLAYIVQDKGNMFFVKREGEVISRHTKAKAIKVRDEINQSI
jgi:hypothetical protein